MKHNRRRSARSSRRSPSVLDRIQVDVAGIDCGASEHYVSVPPDRDPMPIQSFDLCRGPRTPRRLAHLVSRHQRRHGSHRGAGGFARIRLTVR